LPPTPETARGRAPKPAVLLPKISAECAPLEIKARLTGELASAFKDYQRAYQVRHGEPIEAGVLAAQMVAAFIETDRGFHAWRKANPEPLG
jgi:hypothetical protein